MENFRTIDFSISWKTFVSKIEPNRIGLYKKDDKNFIIGWGVDCEIIDGQLDEIQSFTDTNLGKYIFGWLGYDLKNQVEPFLLSENTDETSFPESLLFVPENIIVVINGRAYYKGKLAFDQIEKICQADERFTPNSQSCMLEPSVTKEEYVSTVEKIKDHIQRGDIYEVNYCTNFSATTEINPFQTFIELDERANAPFSSYISLDIGAIICASPERYLLKNGRELISQPIKGTAPRNQKRDTDEKNAADLLNSDKEKAENVMIVDLVRNDLSKIAEKKSVQVSELFGLYSFKTVHQLISTILCQTKEEVNFKDVLHATFPMGSMTGAPKISAMKIAEKHESFKRGIYSGGILLMHPNGNFDVNVVIRSILYNSLKNVVNAPVGSAITIKSDPLKEHEECLIKLEALQKALC